jgi:hypothetical protein
MLEHHLEERLNNLRQHNRLYVLYVIREGADSWTKLVQHFGLIGIGTTEKFLLAEALAALQDAGFIAFVGSLHDDGSNSATRVGGREELGIAYNDRAALHSIHITDRGMRQIRTLGISLKEHSRVLKGCTVVTRPEFHVRRSAGRDVFIAMPFSERFNAVYTDHIAPPLKTLGLSVLRADELAAPVPITDDIFASILSARLLVADCTERNANVFYEVGLAHALGKPVVLVTQDTSGIPFDLAHIRYIRYEFTPRGMAAFEAALQNAVRATIDVDGEKGVRALIAS